MSQTKVTIGQAIDQVLAALESFDEKGKKTILSTVCSHLGVDLDVAVEGASGLAHKAEEKDDSAGHRAHRGTRMSVVDIRKLKEEKQPKSAIQMACLVAYYLSEHAPENEKKVTIRIEDLEKYFKQAGYKLPQKITQLLVNAKGAGYFDSPTRGEYKLNAVGYNLVAHSMPTSSDSK